MVADKLTMFQWKATHPNILAVQVRHGFKKIKKITHSWVGREGDRSSWVGCEYDKNTLYVILKELTQILKGSYAAFQ